MAITTDTDDVKTPLKNLSRFTVRHFIHSDIGDNISSQDIANVVDAAIDNPKGAAKKIASDQNIKLDAIGKTTVSIKSDTTNINRIVKSIDKRLKKMERDGFGVLSSQPSFPLGLNNPLSWSLGARILTRLAVPVTAGLGLAWLLTTKDGNDTLRTFAHVLDDMKKHKTFFDEMDARAARDASKRNTPLIKPKGNPNSPLYGGEDALAKRREIIKKWQDSQKKFPEISAPAGLPVGQTKKFSGDKTNSPNSSRIPAPSTSNDNSTTKSNVLPKQVINPNTTPNPNTIQSGNVPTNTPINTPTNTSNVNPKNIPNLDRTTSGKNIGQPVRNTTLAGKNVLSPTILPEEIPEGINPSEQYPIGLKDNVKPDTLSKNDINVKSLENAGSKPLNSNGKSNQISGIPSSSTPQNQNLTKSVSPLDKGIPNNIVKDSDSVSGAFKPLSAIKWADPIIRSINNSKKTLNIQQDAINQAKSAKQDLKDFRSHWAADPATYDLDRDHQILVNDITGERVTATQYFIIEAQEKQNILKKYPLLTLDSPTSGNDGPDGPVTITVGPETFYIKANVTVQNVASASTNTKSRFGTTIQVAALDSDFMSSYDLLREAENGTPTPVIGSQEDNSDNLPGSLTNIGDQGLSQGPSGPGIEDNGITSLNDEGVTPSPSRSPATISSGSSTDSSRGVSPNPASTDDNVDNGGAQVAGQLDLNGPGKTQGVTSALTDKYGRVISTADTSMTPQERSLLDTIALGDVQSGKSRRSYKEAPDYNTLVGGKHFDGYGQHPGIYNPGLNSTAAGRYQFLKSTWRGTVRAYNKLHPKNPITDFSPESQDRAALFLASQDYSKRSGGRILEDDINSGDPRLGTWIKRYLGGSGRDTTWQSLQLESSSDVETAFTNNLDKNNQYATQEQVAGPQATRDRKSDDLSPDAALKAMQNGIDPATGVDKKIANLYPEGVSDSALPPGEITKDNGTSDETSDLGANPVTTQTSQVATSVASSNRAIKPNPKDFFSDTSLSPEEQKAYDILKNLPSDTSLWTDQQQALARSADKWATPNVYEKLNDSRESSPSPVKKSNPSNVISSATKNPDMFANTPLVPGEQNSLDIMESLPDDWNNLTDAQQDKLNEAYHWATPNVYEKLNDWKKSRDSGPSTVPTSSKTVPSSINLAIAKTALPPKKSKAAVTNYRIKSRLKTGGFPLDIPTGDDNNLQSQFA